MNADEIGDLRSKLADLQKKEFEIKRKIEKLTYSDEQVKENPEDVVSFYKSALKKEQEDQKACLEKAKNEKAIASTMLEDVRKSIARLLDELPKELSIKTDGIDKISNKITMTIITPSDFLTNENKFDVQILATPPKNSFKTGFFHLWIRSKSYMEFNVERVYKTDVELIKDFAIEIAKIVHEHV
jgi:hypothetical protein